MAVLPADKLLYAELMNTEDRKLMVFCSGVLFPLFPFLQAGLERFKPLTVSDKRLK